MNARLNQSELSELIKFGFTKVGFEKFKKGFLMAKASRYLHTKKGGVNE